MIQENVDSENSRDALKLKHPEPEVSAESPWEDDALDRKQIAERLTNLIRTQSIPFVVSIDGYWGTGKTFMLKRWQKDLENQSFQAIYFNAWEDDFCDDPLLAIIGQLSEHLKNSNFQSIVDRVVQVAKPLIRQNALGVLNKATGLTLDVQPDEQRDYLQEYLEQRATKDELRRLLQDLSQSVVEATGHPLVFIIDELDRCRPTFAVELLERVKHIFDVPNLVFVFGINRTELCNALQSIYGEIDAVVYLRRFFDMEFILPEADAEIFCRHLFEKFELHEFFSSLNQDARSNIHLTEFRNISEYMVKLWARLGLSLRDIDYCVRLVALVGKNLGPRSFMYPALLGVLIPLKFKNLTLYRRFIRGECNAGDILNYIDPIVSVQDDYDPLDSVMDTVEAYLYLSDERFASLGSNEPPALPQLILARDPNTDLTSPIYISEKIRQSDAQRIDDLIGRMRDIRMRGDYNILKYSIEYIAGLIDLYQSTLRR